MTGLMLKDLYSLRTYFLKQLGLMTVLYLVLSVAVMKSFAFMAPMLTMSVILMLISSFNVDEASKWDSYALTLPITPKSIVGARYLLFYGALIGTGVLLTAVCALLDSFTFHEGLLSIAAATGAIVALYTLMAAFVLPLFFKLRRKGTRRHDLVLHCAVFGRRLGRELSGNRRPGVFGERILGSRGCRRRAGFGCALRRLLSSLGKILRK